ncbi:acnB [Symbiodinium sp. CCMP2592]|nr:acnB [Symbiodinium sp. CCMP2592]
MLKKAPADGAFYVDLLRNRVNPGVDDSSYVKANFLRDIIHGTASTPLVSKADAVEMLGWMQGGYNVAPLVEALDLDQDLASGAVTGLSRMILMFDAYHDVEDKMKKGNPFAKQVIESWASADWFTSRPTVPEKVTLCVFKVTGETNTDDLSPAPDAWSRPDIPLHALAMLKFPRDGITNAAQQIADLKTKGHQLAYVGDVVGTGSSRKSATNSILWYMGQDIPCAPNKRTGGFVIGGVIAPIFFNTMEDSGALPLEMDVKDLNMGDLIDLCVYDQVIKKHGTDEVITKFDLKHGLMLDQVQAGGRIPLIIGRGLTNKARESLNLGMSTTFKQMAQPDVNVKGFTLAQKMVGKACGLDGVVPGAYCEPSMGTVGSQDTTGPMTRDELKDLACLGFQADLVMQSFCHTAAYPKPVDVITHRTLPKFIADRGGVALRPGDGIIHSWLNRMLLPDEVGDSHTRFPLGISFPAGSGLVAFGAATGVMPLNMPESVLVRFSGKMQPGVTLRDLVHAIPYYAIQQGLLTVEKKGKKNIFNGRILEIEGLPDLKCEQAFELSDASAERSAAGCTIKLNEDSVKEYLTSNITLLKWMISEGYSDPRTLARRVSKMEKWLESPTLLEADKEAEYAAVININLDELKEPVLCCPNDPDDAKTLTEIGTAGIDEVFIGSCMTNIGHYRAAGKMLSQFDGQLSTRLWIAPPTKMDEEQLTKEGYYSVYGKVGARTEMPGCSLCMGNQARVADNATVVSTSTRNFPNRLGKGANVYLASAELASVAAILGRLPTKEEYLKYHAELAKNEDSIYKYLNFDQVEDYVAKADKEEQEEDEEPIPFAETVWNVALVLGFTDAGWLDIILTLILACMSAFMQSLFVVVILSPSFLGEPFESEIQIARTWRANIAHDSKYKDLADTSLASRVCNGDGSLIQSTVQANLLSEIDSFLGISATGEPFEPSNLQPGTILSGLCILLWCIYLCKEFRAIWVSVEAALQIPRAHVTIFKTGRFVTISWRRLGVYLTLRLARTAVAGCLLYAGIQWLARTTNIADLILNAVALGAILEIDEMIFASLLPKKVQVAIYELEAIQVKYTRAKSQLEGLFIFIMVATLSLAPFFLWVQPLSQTMIAVKKEYCANNQDFVMAFNEVDKDGSCLIRLRQDSDSPSLKRQAQDLGILEHVLAGVGTLIVGIGAIVGILGLSQAAAIADDRMLVEGQTNFQFELGTDEGEWYRSVVFFHEAGVDCREHQNSLSIVHVATNTSQRLWIHETGCWPGPLDYHGVSLYQSHALDARDTEGRNGTFAVTSGYRTWVVDGYSDYAPRLHRLLYHRQIVPAVIGSVLAVVGFMLCCVACCCMAGQQSAPVKAPSTYPGAAPLSN